MLKVIEVFRSIQGEGIELGLPTIFIRFSGCNLHCTWCDTTYASREGNKFEELTVEQLIEKVESFAPTAGVTFTGGEPLIQDSEEMDKLIYELKGRGYKINIETNGVLFPSLRMVNSVDRFSISPKLASSGNRNGIVIETLQKYLKTQPKAMFLKFVIGDEADFDQMLTILANIGDKEELKDIPIVVQPNVNYKTAESIEEQSKGFRELLDILLMGGYSSQVRDYGIRIIPQFHKYIWANKRAV
jgi:7-carboxy-7-deazaguanine synthase